MCMSVHVSYYKKNLTSRLVDFTADLKSNCLIPLLQTYYTALDPAEVADYLEGMYTKG